MNFKKLFPAFLAALLFLCSSLTAVADSIENVPYPSYSYWFDGKNRHAMETKACYIPERSISNISADGSMFVSLDHIFAFNDQLFITDGGKGVVYVLDRNYNLVRTINEFENGGERVSFVGATGLFADKDGIYIADTQNKRVICTDGKNVTKIITKPDSPIIPEKFDFAPTRIVRDRNGYFYILCKGSYYGMALFSDTFEFLGFYGANNVEKSLSDAITDLITSAFETEEKHSASIQALPFQLIDISADSEGFITAISDQWQGQIKRLGTNGTNILKYNSQFQSSSANGLNFADTPQSYQDKTSKYASLITERFVAVTTDDNGYIYAVDSTQGRVFLYDTECNLINVFGGGLGNGNQLGSFSSPNAITCFGNDVLVSDFITGMITVFRCTDYGENIKAAQSLTLESKYSEAEPYWERIYNEDKNCQLAYKGLAKAYLDRGDNKKAMEYARRGLDQVTYAAAFKNVRNSFLSRNFIWIGITAVGLITATVWFIRESRKQEVVLIRNQKINIALTSWIHPFRGFDRLKNYGDISPLSASGILFVFYAVTVIMNLNTGFMYKIADTNSFNAVYTLIGTVGVAALYTVMNWAVSVLASGRGTLKEIYCSTCYCLIPLIIWRIFYLLLTHTVIATSNGGFEVAGMIVEIYTVMLLLIATTVIHDFSFFKSVGIAFATVIGMCIVAFILFIMLSLGQNTVTFVMSVINEILLR